MSRVGIVIPTYKESDNIAKLLRELRKTIPDAAIVVVDDSPDTRTVDAARGVGDPLVEIIHREIKDGRGSAAILGLRRHVAEGCDRIIEMDADFSHAPYEIPALLAALESTGCDMIIASRYLPESRIVHWPLGRRLFSRCANLLARSLLRVPVHDYTNGFRLYSRSAAEIIDATCGRLGRGFIPLSEILVNLHYRGYRIAEIPSVFVNRARGESSVTLTEVRQALFGLFSIYRLKRTLESKGRKGS